MIVSDNGTELTSHAIFTWARDFAGRVAASLLNAAGLPELITYITEEYEQTALALAREPHTLAATRSKLAPLELPPV